MARKKIETGGFEEQKKLDLGNRIKIIRKTFFDDNNRLFSDKIGESEQTLSQICSGNRYGGLAIVQKILDNIPEINANWLLSGKEEMVKNDQRVGDISNSTVSGVNVSGNGIQINPDAYNTLLEIVEKHHLETKKFQEQIDRLLAIIEKKQ